MLKKFVNWLMARKFYKHVLLKWLPFIRLSTYYTDIRGFKYHQGYRLLEPGHIILSVDNRKLISYIIPGDFSHAALCVSKGDYRYFEIAEMTHTNYTESYFYDLCKEADRVVILECTAFNNAYVDRIITKCLSFQGAKYDTSFSLVDKALYCSELVYKSDFEHKLQVNLEDLAGLGYEYISPDGLYKAKNVKVIWDSKT